MSGKLSFFKGMVKTMNMAKPSSPSQQEKPIEQPSESTSEKKLSKIMAYVSDLQTPKAQKNLAQTPSPTQPQPQPQPAAAPPSLVSTSFKEEFEFVEEDSTPSYVPMESKLRSISSARGNSTPAGPAENTAAQVIRSQSAIDLLSFDEPSDDPPFAQTHKDMNRSATSENLLDFEFEPAQQNSRSISASSGVPTGVDIWDLMGSVQTPQPPQRTASLTSQPHLNSQEDLLGMFSSPVPMQNRSQASKTGQQTSDFLIDL